MLAATAAEFLELQPLRRRLPVLGRRIIPLFAITALQRNNLSGHKTAPNSNLQITSLPLGLFTSCFTQRTKADQGRLSTTNKKAAITHLSSRHAI
jgi:hypothetical protein